MKKEYIKPETSLVEVEVMTMLAGSPTVLSIDRYNHADEELSNEHRRGWGDLWVEWHRWQKEGVSKCDFVILSAAKDLFQGLILRFFALLRMTR